MHKGRVSRASFEVPSGKLFIGDPYDMGYAQEEIDHLLDGLLLNKNKGTTPFTKVRRGVLCSTDGEEVGLYVFRNNDAIAVTRDIAGYEQRFTNRMSRKVIPIGELIGLPGFMFHPKELATDEGKLEMLFANPPFVSHAKAEGCEFLVADAQRYARPSEQWTARFPDIEQKYHGSGLGVGTRKMIEDVYNGILSVTPGTYQCTNYQKWHTVVIKRRLTDE